MSAISIRFDGLFLLVALALGAAAYLLVALVALAQRHPAKGARSRRIARLAGAMASASLLLFAILFAWWTRQGTGHKDIDWLDLLVFPWIAIFLAGCWHLARRVTR